MTGWGILMQRSAWFLIVLFAVPPTVAASNDFQEWKESRKQEVEAFREARDQAFHNFLSEQWEAFQVYRGERQDETPKPRTIPKAPSDPAGDEPGRSPVDEQDSIAAPIKVEPDRVTSTPEPEETPAQADGGAGPDARGPSGSVPASRTSSEREASFRFLGHDLQVPLPRAWHESKAQEASESGVAAFWADFAQADAGPAVGELMAIRERLRLNGWGYLQLVQAMAHAVHGQGNSAVALAWGVMLKSGYDLRMGYAGGEMMLLFRPRGELFGVPYFQLDGRRYYLFAHDGGAVPKVHTYRGDYEGASEAVGVALQEAPRTSGEREQREITAEYQGKTYQYQVPVDTALVAYLRTLPQQTLGAYFWTRPHPALEEHLVQPLRRVTREMARSEQVDFLLRLVQTGFEYRTDQDQFGREDYLYPEETLYYPASDCEDRAVLFAWLVREVLGLQVAVLDYPGHVATAVGLGKGAGVQVRIDGQALTVADPTYINARAGMVMPKYREKRPNVIPLW